MFIWYDSGAFVEGQNITGFMVHASTRPEHFNTLAGLGRLIAGAWDSNMSNADAGVKKLRIRFLPPSQKPPLSVAQCSPQYKLMWCQGTEYSMALIRVDGMFSVSPLS